MKRWYNRKPETMQDWLMLFAVAAALLAAVWYLPAIAAALRVLLGLATPFAGGLALAYVLDIPARWFAIHLFGGRRGPGILLAYLALFGTVAALVGLVVPQLVQSVGSFAAALPGYLENAQALLELVQANYGVDTTSLSELLLNSGSSVENFLSGLAPQLAQAAMGAAGQVLNGFLALAASVYLLCGKAELLHTARLALRTALPPRTAGSGNTASTGISLTRISPCASPQRMSSSQYAFQNASPSFRRRRSLRVFMSERRLFSAMYRTANSRRLAMALSRSSSRPRNSGCGTVGSIWLSTRIYGSGMHAGSHGMSFSRQNSVRSRVTSWMPL